MRVPVTVLTGFLGAGKTTLLNRLLRTPDFAGAAVLVNEFGEIGIDHLLVERLTEEVALLEGGCLCCMVRGDLVRALEDLAARIAAGTPVRRVVIETTGLADPAPILQTLMTDRRVLRGFALDGVATLVDAVAGAATLDAQSEAMAQVAVADWLVLTKTDIAAPGVAAALTARLRALNPGAPLFEAASVPAAALLDAANISAGGRAVAVAAQPAPQAGRHDRSIESFTLTFDAPLPWQGVSAWLGMLALTRGESLLRVKGLLNIAGEDSPVVVHGVQHVFHPPAMLAAWPQGHDRKSRLVFVLRNLPREVVEQGLSAFIAATDEKTIMEVR
ncbi:CobW family GTP-binding protein [Roseomonas fluvialis]|uniref:ATP-binding protein n=1 Tax=Roseomonas fluvialis TaxID=1750527 RepID=A0ABN6P193_9PROT|nr:GTP-binding protein [Roseomonas fluvialis]BDG72433.1 ATP-binding protein [Roseomonas fluvialis]